MNRATVKKNENDGFARLKQIIEEHDNLLIISHILPDGDNIGSVIALTRSLEMAGKSVQGIVNGDLPEYYRFLSGTEALIPPEEADFNGCDLLIAVDSADKSRVGDKAAACFGRVTTVNIDHHISNDRYADFNYVDPNAGATAEILTEFLLATGYPMDETVAAALYVGLLTDTGSFTFQNTRAETLAAAAKLLTYPIDLPAMRENIYGNVALRRKRLLGHILCGAETEMGGDIIWSAADAAICRKLEVESADFEGCIDHLIAVSGVKIAILLRELDEGEVKVGFRTKTGYDAVAVSKPFGGGGHPGAAGCNVEGSMAAATEKILRVARAYLEERR